MSEQVKLSLSQIERITHALGFDPKRINNGRYEAHRNYSVYSREQESWEELVNIGYATKRKFNDANQRQIGYYVSNLGMRWLGCLYGCVITVME